MVGDIHRATGRSKTAIRRAIKLGQLPLAKRNSQGYTFIDLREVMKLWPAATSEHIAAAKAGAATWSQNDRETVALRSDNVRLSTEIDRVQNELAEERRDARAERERSHKLLEIGLQTVRSLRNQMGVHQPS